MVKECIQKHCVWTEKIRPAMEAANNQPGKIRAKKHSKFQLLVHAPRNYTRDVVIHRACFGIKLLACGRAWERSGKKLKFIRTHSGQAI